METNPNPSPSSSPNSSSSNGIRSDPPPPPTPKSLPPPPTTFVQADPQSFKHMVQLLTGSTDAAAATRVKNPIPPLSRPKKPTSSSFKLYERRPSMKNLKAIGPLIASSNSTSARAPLSPSVLDFPSLALSPVTPLIPDPFDRCPTDPNHNPNPPPNSAEERAIAERGFFLHPSPRSTEPPPRLLPLFPLASPKNSSND